MVNENLFLSLHSFIKCIVMNIKKIILSGCLLLSVWGEILAFCVPLPNRPDSLYLFSYSTTKNHCRDGLHFAWSGDGKRFNL